MLHVAIPRDCEEAAAATPLVMGSRDRKTGIVAIQQRANATVADEQHIARSIARQDKFDFAHDPRLGIDRSLPTPYAGMRLGEELIGHRLELGRH